MRVAVPTLMALLLALLAAVPGDDAHAGEELYGHWLVGNGRAIIELKPCGSEVCGEIAWLAAPATDAGAPKTDSKNPDPGARLRPLCRLQLIRGLMRESTGRFEGGEIYSTRDGRTYGLDVELDGPQTLRVRGYLGLPLLGKTQEWRRLADDRGGCAVMSTPVAAR